MNHSVCTEDCVCEGEMWTCDDINAASEEFFAEVNSNGDANINMGDEVDSDHLDLLIYYCDTNNDG